jgi:HsdR family type I site-specific deoxyribonuclease
VSSEDRDTRSVFGDYIHIYDMQQAKEDGATLAIYYESRLAKLSLKKEELPHIDDEVDELAEDEEESQQSKLKSKWAALEKIVGAPPRIASVAADLVKHFEERQQAQSGKAMIVGMSREICVHLYDELIKLRPDWHNEDPEIGALKIIMTGSASDKALLRPHIYQKQTKKRLEKRFKDPQDPLQLVIVRDMWLTGFDAPCVHTLYVDKPMKGHNLMQAIARVNRVFKDKQGGLVDMAKKFRAAASRGDSLGLTDDEVKFYDALANNESAALELGDEILKKIAHELTENLRQNLSVDWSQRESVRAKLRLKVKRILRKYKYPPDQQEEAIQTVLQQAEALSFEWVA